MNKTILIILLTVFTIPVASSQWATYDITFTSIWNATDHSSIPAGAHWSKLVGATHKTADTFWKTGSLATAGIKSIAETGSNTLFKEEVLAKISSGEAEKYIDGPNLGAAIGDQKISNLKVLKEYPLFTLTSMIAPSPDWLIVINSYNLLDAAGNWKKLEIFDVFAYDSGTDSGTDYTSENSVTSPFANTSRVSGLPFNGKKIGTCTISINSKVEPYLAIKDNPFDKVKVYPNPVSNGQITITNLANIHLNKVEVFNTSGLRQKSIEDIKQDDMLIVDTQDLTSGVYLLKLITDKNESVIQKIIIE